MKGSFMPECAAQLRYWAKQPFTMEEGSATESLASSPTRAPDSGSSSDSSGVPSVQQEESAAVSRVDLPETNEPSGTQESVNCGSGAIDAEASQNEFCVPQLDFTELGLP